MTLELGNVRIALRAEGKRLANLIKECCQGSTHFTDQVSCPGDITINVFETDYSQMIKRLSTTNLYCIKDRDCVTVAENNIYCEIDNRDELTATQFYYRHLDRLLKFVAYRAGYVPLHAAALISPEEELVLIVGDRGAGKTTTSIVLGTAGWEVLTDELVLVDLGSQGVTVHGFLREYHVDRKLCRAVWPNRCWDAEEYYPGTDKLTLFGQNNLIRSRKSFSPERMVCLVARRNVSDKDPCVSNINGTELYRQLIRHTEIPEGLIPPEGRTKINRLLKEFSARVEGKLVHKWPTLYPLSEYESKFKYIIRELS